MDDDTIFPAVSLGEEVISKYRDSLFCGQLEMIIILTNLRLLIRWKLTSCGCFSRSSYSSINLHSIHRIDEIPSNPSSLLISILLITFIAGFTATIVGLTISSGDAIVIIGALLMIGSITGIVLLFVLYQRKYIKLKGTFGTTLLRFSVDVARELETTLSEMIYHRKMKRTLQEIKHL